ncbi:MAG: response regulator transcription factor [Elusimicrobia bacterium]|nr:response regulator transcription factor [Elusimicrobiota bacterium]
MGAKGKILVVDDDPELGALIRDVLASGGYDPETVSTARECFLRLEKPAPPALILMDVMLPDLDGFEALERLKRAGATKVIPVILLSTLDGKSYRKRAEEKGAAAYVPKPFEPAALLDAVRRALEAPGARSPAS